MSVYNKPWTSHTGAAFFVPLVIHSTLHRIHRLLDLLIVLHRLLLMTRLVSGSLLGGLLLALESQYLLLLGGHLDARRAMLVEKMIRLAPICPVTEEPPLEILGKILHLEIQ